MSTWLVTGASRGIGLEYVRQIVERGDTVFATVRSSSKAVELRELQEASVQGSLEIVELDVRKLESIASAVKIIDSILQGNRGLDYLISSAGINNESQNQVLEMPSNIKPEEMMDVFRTNVVGSILVYQHFLPFLERSKRPGGPVLVNMSSGMGSMTRAASGQHPIAFASYSISKAALNMLTVKQALEKPNIIVISMAPGWCKTDMGGPDAVYEVDYSVRNQLKVVLAATPADSGKYKFLDGSEVHW